MLYAGFLVPKAPNFSKKTFELSRSLVPDFEESEVQTDEDIAAISVKCWSFHESDHQYHDCLGEKKLFCSGCEPKNIQLVPSTIIHSETSPSLNYDPLDSKPLHQNLLDNQEDRNNARSHVSKNKVRSAMRWRKF